MSIMKRYTTARMAAALLSRVPYGCWRREALPTNITKYRDPPRNARKGSAVPICISSIGILARAVVRWTVGARFPLAIENDEHEISSPVKRKLCCLAVACNTLVWTWTRETWRWLMSTTLPCFNMPGFRAVAAKEQSYSKRGFFTSSIFPIIELTGGEGVGSSKSSYAASVPKNLRRTRKP